MVRRGDSVRVEDMNLKACSVIPLKFMYLDHRFNIDHPRLGTSSLGSRVTPKLASAGGYEQEKVINTYPPESQT